MAAPRKSVLFVCIGNACRSQMAEAFARAYGSDVLDAASAGLAPAYYIPDLTVKVMHEKNISMVGHAPKGFEAWVDKKFDLAVNLSGRKLPSGVALAVEDWPVEDPIGGTEETFREVRDRIEGLVMRLVLAARAEAGSWGQVAENAPAQTPAPRDAGSTPGQRDVPRRRKFLR